jgi:hypothetical protein
MRRARVHSHTINPAPAERIAAWISGGISGIASFTAT